MSFTNTQGDGSGTPAWFHANSDGELISAWHPTLQSDETADDSDKTLTVPALTEWEILSIWVEFTTTATAGTRQLVVEIQDSASDVIGRMVAPITQIASLTNEYYFGAMIGHNITSLRDTTFVFASLPKLILPAAFIIRVYDNKAIDAAADDMIIQMMTNERSVP